MTAVNSCERDVQTILHEAIKYFDFSVVEGKRSTETQHNHWKKGRELKSEGLDPKVRVNWKIIDESKVVTTKDGYEKLSRHQIGEKSEAVDIVPYPSMWKDQLEFQKLAMVIKVVQSQLLSQGKIERVLDWGYDLWKWDMPHWQLREVGTIVKT